MLRPDRRDKMIAVIDHELIDMGAEPYLEHQQKLRKLDDEYDNDYG